MNNTLISQRLRISFFGRRNVGKSSLINAITNQDLSIISDIPGTTTDPVSKTMELLPLGPVVLTDTAGFDDQGQLGVMRVQKTYDILNNTDIAVIVFDINQNDFSYENKFIDKIKKTGKIYILVANKDDDGKNKSDLVKDFSDVIFVSVKNKFGIEKLKNKIGSLKISENKKIFLDGIVGPNKVIMLVCPIDESAPKGRIILPQTMAVRDILDNNGICIAVQPSQVNESLKKVKPDYVITDSQAFSEVNEAVPEDIPLTSFSILMARYKSELKYLIEGAEALDTLEDGDKVLIAEACTHHAQKNDIGKVQIPKKILAYTKKKIEFDYTNGGTFIDNLEDYKLIVHCGGCMISETAMTYRQSCAIEKNVPMTNYGVILAKLSGILERVKI